MLVSQKWEKQRLEIQGHPQLHNIVNVPLPSQQASKILQELQVSCNSSNKTTQLEALQCWEAWITSHNPEDWDIDSMCQFAMKPLLTKKLYPLHKDEDICKLKLKIMWKLLVIVRNKLALDGPQHILNCFLKSSFLWLESINHLSNDVTVLILKLLLMLFMNSQEPVKCGNYVFPPLSVEADLLEKLFHNYVDAFLNVFNNWKKIQDINLVLKLWKWLLEHCEFYNESLATPVWHRIFKVNQTLCSDKTESVKLRLTFLRACSTNVKTVLLSSKYIGGESCFMTPCEVMLKKLVEICTVECEDSPDREIFLTCEEISKILTHRSVEIKDYNLCINLLDALEDFTLKSTYWGSWCGLVCCFKKTLLDIETKYFTKNQMKFYRKLRAATVNFELDKTYLDEESIISVYNNIKLLDIGCFCTNNFSKVSIFVESLSDKKTEGNNKFELGQSHQLVPITFNSKGNEIISDTCNNYEKALRVTFGFDSGKFGSFSLHMFRNSKLDTLSADIERFKNIFETMPSATKKLLLNGFLNVDFSRLKFNINDQRQSANSKEYLSSSKTLSPRTAETKTGKNEDGKPNVKCDSTPLKRGGKNTGKRKRGFLRSEKENKESWEEEADLSFSRKTRSKMKAEKLGEIKKIEESPGKRKRMRFEVRVQEIVKKNKLRKSEKNISENVLGPINKRELRSRRKSDAGSVQEKKEQVVRNNHVERKKEFCQRTEKRKEEEKPGKVTTDGKLEKFFKVINSLGNDKKDASVKLEKKTKRKINKKAKAAITWKQTSLLETVVRESEEHMVENKEETNVNEAASPTDEIFTSNSAEEDHKYAMRLEDDEDEKKKLKISINSADDPESVISNGTKTCENDLETQDHVKESEVECNTHPDSSVRKDEKKSTAKLNVENAENDVCLRVEVEMIVNEIKVPEEENVETKNEIRIEGIEETEISKPDMEEKTDTEHSAVKGLTRGRKRSLESESSCQLEAKKIKYTEIQRDVEIPVQESVTKPVEMKEASTKEDSFVSPTKLKGEIENSTGEGGSPKNKTESSPNETTKVPKRNSRTMSSRVQKMIALIPDSNLHGSQTSWDLSPKVDQKARGKKYVGVDRSSRVSRMLANLTKQMPRATEDPEADDEKTNSDVINGSAIIPAANSTVAKLLSPRFGKKKKFISFDETKNETVVYLTDTPPSQVMSGWEKIKECYCSPEREINVEIQAETPPSHHWRPKPKSKDEFCSPEEEEEATDSHVGIQSLMVT